MQIIHPPTLQDSSRSVTPAENGHTGLVTVSSYRTWILVMVSSKFLTTLVKSFSAKLSFSLSLVAAVKRNEQKRSNAEIKTFCNTELLHENNPKELTQLAAHVISFTYRANI